MFAFVCVCLFYFQFVIALASGPKHMQQGLTNQTGTTTKYAKQNKSSGKRVV